MKEKLKSDTEELFSKLVIYQRNHAKISKSLSDNIKSLEGNLRLLLYGLRTDEENKKQREVDTYC